MAFCTEMQIDHTLEDLEVPTVEVLQVFGVRVRDGAFLNRLPGVRADTVSAAWRAVAEVNLMEGRPNPRKPPGSSSRNLDKRLTRMLRHWGYQDPPPPPKRESNISRVCGVCGRSCGRRRVQPVLGRPYNPRSFLLPALV